MTLAGELSAESKMGEIMETLPGAKRALFAKYHLGGCSSCAFSDNESLAELAKRSDLAAEEMLEHLLASHAHDEQMVISPTEAKRRMDDGETIRFLDIRTREEHEAVAIPGSDFFTQESQQAFFALDPATFILIYDHQGKGMLDQVAWFRGHKMNNTFGLKGGIDAWSREVDPSIQRYRLEME